MAKKGKNSNYNYTRQQQIKEKEKKEAEARKKERRAKRGEIIIGTLLFIAVTVLGAINLKNPSKLLEIVTYGVMTVACALFYDNFKATNKKFSVACLIIAAISFIVMIIMLINLNGGLKMS